MLRCSGANAFESSAASSSERTITIALFFSIALRATAAVGSVVSWRSTSFATSAARRHGRCEEDGAGIGVVLGLGEHVGGEEPGIALGGDDEDLGGTGDEIDADISREQLLRRGYVDVSGTYDAIGARDGFGSVSKSRDGLRAAHLEDLVDAEDVRGSVNLVDSLGAGYADVLHARHLRGHGGHDQRGRERIAAGGDVAAHGVQRPHDLTQTQARAEGSGVFGGDLAFRR